MFAFRGHMQWQDLAVRTLDAEDSVPTLMLKDLNI